MKRILLILVATLCYSSFTLFAYQDKDVTKMGDIWIITVDKSGSMVSAKRDVSSITKSTTNRLLKSNVFDSADFTQDRFLFLISGFQFNKYIGHGNSFIQSTPFEESLIHPTDNILHSFSNKEQLVNHIAKEVMSTKQFKYSYDYSFVSLLRTFSIVHAVEFLIENNEAANFDNLYVMSITDDADQNDQWRMDYRNLKESGAHNKIEEVNEATTKYVFNELTNKGEGVLIETYSDDKTIPHIWLYEYKTRSQMEQLTHTPPISIHATDGNTFSLSKSDNYYNGEKICFIHVDSVAVNGTQVALNTSFDKKFKTAFSYDNKPKLNNVTVWGWFQVEYNDPIYGLHYKVVPFESNEKVISNALQTTINILLTILVLAIIGTIIYLLLVLPRKRLFTIYSGLGITTEVKRGFGREWTWGNNPIQCYTQSYHTAVGCISRKHKRVHSSRLATESHANEILICSRQPLLFSQDVISLSTTDNIKEIYRIRQNAYPQLLKEIYEASFICKLHDSYINSHNRYTSRILKTFIRLVNLINRKYYYVISDITQYQTLYIVHSNYFEEKRFLLECTTNSSLLSTDTNYAIITSTLNRIYTIDNQDVFDILISAVAHNNNIYWNILEIQNRKTGCTSLRSVKLLAHYIQEGNTSVNESLAIIEKYLAKSFKSARISQYVSLTPESDVSAIQPMTFDIEKPTAPAFISFVEDTEMPKTQTLYSPIKDGQQREIFVTIKPKYRDGILYKSLIPMEYISDKHPLAQRFSNAIIRVNIYKAKRLILNTDGFNFGDINNKY